MYSLFITISFVLVSMLFEVSALSVPAHLAKRDDFREMHDAMNNAPRQYLPQGQAWDNRLVKRDPTICTVHVIVQIVELWYPTEYTRHVTEGETITGTVTAIIILPAEPTPPVISETTPTESSSTETIAWESNTSTWASNTDETLLTAPTTYFFTEPQPSWTFVESFTETYLAITDYDLTSTGYSKTTYTTEATDSAECAVCVVTATATGAFCSQTTDATTFYYTYRAGGASHSGPPIVSMNPPTTSERTGEMVTTIPYVETTIWQTRSDLMPPEILTQSPILISPSSSMVQQQLLAPVIPDTRPPKETITGPADRRATPIRDAKPPRKTPSKPHTTIPDREIHTTPTTHFTAPPILIPDLAHHTTLTIPQIQWQQRQQQHQPVTITLRDGSRTTITPPAHTPTVITLADHSVTTLSPAPLLTPRPRPRTFTLPPAPGHTKSPVLFAPPPPATTQRVITTGGLTITIPALRPVRATATAVTTTPLGGGSAAAAAPTVVLTTRSTVLTLPWTTLTLLHTDSLTTTLGGTKNRLLTQSGGVVLSTFSTVVTLPWTTMTVVQTGTVSPASPSSSSSSSSTQPFRSVNVLATDSASAPSQTGPLVLPLPTGESTDGGEEGERNSAGGLRGDKRAALLAAMAAAAGVVVVM